MATTEEERTEQRDDEANPLVEGLERMPVHPTTMVIFGATGDLSKRKLLPAIYNLAHEGALPETFFLVGCWRSAMPPGDFRDLAIEAMRKFSRPKPDEKVLDAPGRRARASAPLHRALRRGC